MFDQLTGHGELVVDGSPAEVVQIGLGVTVWVPATAGDVGLDADA